MARRKRRGRDRSKASKAGGAKPPAKATPRAPKAAEDLTAEAFQLESQAEQARLDRVRSAIRRRQAGEILRKQDINDIAWYERRLNSIRAKKFYSTMTYQEFLQLVGLPKVTISRWMDRGLAKTKNDDGTWNLFRFIDWISKNATFRQAAAASDEEGSAARLQRIKADREQIALDQLRGDIDIEFQAKFAAFCAEICGIFVAQPRHLSLRLANRPAAEVEAELAAYNQARVIALAQGRSGLKPEQVDKIRAILAVEKPQAPPEDTPAEDVSA